MLNRIATLCILVLCSFVGDVFAITESRFVLTTAAELQVAAQNRRTRADFIANYPSDHLDFVAGSTVWMIFMLDITPGGDGLNNYQWSWQLDGIEKSYMTVNVAEANYGQDYTALVVKYNNITEGNWRVHVYKDGEKMIEKGFVVGKEGTPARGSLVLVYPVEIQLAVGESFTMKMQTQGAITKETYSFKSDNEAVATVSTAGKVTAVAPGVSLISVTGVSSKGVDTCLIVVLPDSGFVIVPNKNVFTAGEECVLDVVAGSGSEAVDVYVALLTPDGTYYCVKEDGTWTEPNTTAPMASSWVIEAGIYRALKTNIPDTLVAGAYQWLVISVKPGDDPMVEANRLLTAVADFTIN